MCWKRRLDRGPTAAGGRCDSASITANHGAQTKIARAWAFFHPPERDAKLVDLT